MIIKLLILFLGLIVGFFCGVEGSTVGGNYCIGLTQTQEKYLQSKSWLFNIVKKCTWLTYILGTPVGYLPMCIITCLLMILFPEVESYIKSIDIKIFGSYVALYLGSMLLMYFVGLWKGDDLQEKYAIYKIKD